MEKGSSIMTGSFTVTAASLVPIVSWLLDLLFPAHSADMPETLPYLIAAGLVTGSHAAYNIGVAYLRKRGLPPDAAPEVAVPAIPTPEKT
jgi:drug/metabolite transporter (DMT)-like permease